MVPVTVVMTVVVLSVEAAAGTTCTLGPLAGTVDGATAARDVVIAWVVPGSVVWGTTEVLTPGADTVGDNVV